MDRVDESIVDRSVILPCPGFIGRQDLVDPLKSTVGLDALEAITPTGSRHQWLVTLTSTEAARALLIKDVLESCGNTLHVYPYITSLAMIRLFRLPYEFLGRF